MTDEIIDDTSPAESDELLIQNPIALRKEEQATKAYREREAAKLYATPLGLKVATNTGKWGTAVRIPNKFGNKTFAPRHKAK